MVVSPPREVWRDYFFVTPDRILFQDDEIVVVRDRTPKASEHLLVIPRFEAISGTESLRPSHIPLLAHMLNAGEHVMTLQRHESSAANEELVVGFHRKPLRSVDHLHLHVLHPPFTPPKNRYKYWELPLFLPVAFISLASLVEKLRRRAEKESVRAR